jgi:YHS domain-containing protein
MSMARLVCLLWLLSFFLSEPVVGQNKAAPADRRADQEALKAYAPLVGSWRGAGLVRRGSAKGAWTERAAWTWDLRDRRAALKITVERGRHLKEGLLRPDTKPGEFTFEVTLADGSKRRFLGRAAERGVLVLNAETPPEEGLARVTLTPLHETRFLLLLEGASRQSQRLERLGEVGYTREGALFAAGDSYPECIVTGGRGTIRVEHKGQSYYVCCTGCKDLFDEDPEVVLAEYKARLKERKP